MGDDDVVVGRRDDDGRTGRRGVRREMLRVDEGRVGL